MGLQDCLEAPIIFPECFLYIGMSGYYPEMRRTLERTYTMYQQATETLPIFMQSKADWRTYRV